jgi:anti-anti-sigma factor
MAEPILVSADGDDIVVTLAGDIDLAVERDLRSHLTDAVEAGPARILIDMDGVTFIDSTGIGSLVRAHTQARRSSISLQIVRPSSIVTRQLRIMGLYGLFQASPIDG